MKKILFLGLLVVGLLIVYGCVPPEEAENQAAQALEQLSDDELQQLEDETAKMGEGIAIAGQGYRIPSSASINLRNAVTAMQRVNTQRRNDLISQEITVRVGSQLGSVDSPCTATSGCVQGLMCLPDSVTRRDTCQAPWPLGTPCIYDRACASSICGRNQNNELVCEPSGQPFGNVCGKETECASNECDLLRHICLIPTGSPCENSLDCATVFCATPPDDSVGRESMGRVCRERYATPNGGNCVEDNECRSRLCGYVSYERMGVCEGQRSNEEGDACRMGEECISGRCIIGSDIAVPVFEDIHLRTSLGYCG